ncbi:MAG: hypothetical protein ABIW76_04125 [Fibrobacteria bacterium]
MEYGKGCNHAGYHPKAGGYFLSWRLLGTESAGTAFNVYKGATRLNSALLTGAMNYQDATAAAGVTGLADFSRIRNESVPFRLHPKAHKTAPGRWYARDAGR